jgi:hypothetical protein
LHSSRAASTGLPAGLEDLHRLRADATTPGWDVTGNDRAATVATLGSPVPIGPAALARAALLTCAHHVTTPGDFDGSSAGE